MTQKIYQVDAFADRIFAGNPAAVCPLGEWRSDDVLQKIAMENNQAETAFFVRSGDQFEIRWFTPAVEVDLCGHATLASAYVLFHIENWPEDTIHFHSPRSGPLTVSKKGEWLTLNFPTDTYAKVELTDDITAGFNFRPQLAFRGKTDHMLVFDNEEQIQQMVPVLDKIAKLPGRGAIVTAKGNTAHFVSRFFAPQSGINEDPVTGSAHTTLVPFWANDLGITEMNALQLSARGGHLQCKYLGERVEISGQAKLYMAGEIYF